MSNKSISDIIDITESLEDGLNLDIKGISKVQKDKTGNFIVITTADNKKYRTYSSIIIESLEKVIAAKFNFEKDVLKACVKVTESADGNEYFTLVSQK